MVKTSRKPHRVRSFFVLSPFSPRLLSMPFRCSLCSPNVKSPITLSATKVLARSTCIRIISGIPADHPGYQSQSDQSREVATITIGIGRLICIKRAIDACSVSRKDRRRFAPDAGFHSPALWCRFGFQLLLSARFGNLTILLGLGRALRARGRPVGLLRLPSPTHEPFVRPAPKTTTTKTAAPSPRPVGRSSVLPGPGRSGGIPAASALAVRARARKSGGRAAMTELDDAPRALLLSPPTAGVSPVGTRPVAVSWHAGTPRRTHSKHSSHGPKRPAPRALRARIRNSSCLFL